jgi:hypothetical protein
LNQPRSEGREHPEDAAMWPTWNLLPVPARWTYVMRVMMVSLALSVSACTAPGHSLPNPPAHSGNEGLGGPLTSGDGDGGNGM